MCPDTRHSRADRGSVRLNERDLRAIEWLFDMVAIFERDVPRMITPMSPISVSAARSIVTRWAKAGVAQADPVLAHQGRLVRLTGKGRTLVSSEGDLAEPVTSSVTNHIHLALVSRARLGIERHGIAGAPVRRWTSERQWRHENNGRRDDGDYVPNGVAHLANGEVGLVHVGHTAVEIDMIRLRLPELVDTCPLMIIVVPAELMAAARDLFGPLSAGRPRLEFVAL